MNALAQRLNPGRVRVSPKFTAVLAFLLDEEWTQPAIIEMAITSDGFVLAGTTEDPLLDDMIGEAEDLDRNLRGVAEAAGLSGKETQALLDRAASYIKDWRR